MNNCWIIILLLLCCCNGNKNTKDECGCKHDRKPHCEKPCNCGCEKEAPAWDCGCENNNTFSSFYESRTCGCEE